MNPFRTAVSFLGQLGTNYLEFEWLVPKTGLEFLRGQAKHSLFSGTELLVVSNDVCSVHTRPTVLFNFFCVRVPDTTGYLSSISAVMICSFAAYTLAQYS